MPKRVDVVAQRRMISNAALEVINQVGLDRARLRDVAIEASVTTGAVMHYFDGKDAVVEAALEEIVRRTLERMDQATPPEEAAMDVASFVKRVAAYLPLDEKRHAEWRVWLAFWGRAIADERLRDVHRGYYDAIIDRLTVRLRVFRGDATASEGSVRRCANALVAAVDGIGTRATLEPERWPAERQRDTLETLLRPMLEAFT